MKDIYSIWNRLVGRTYDAVNTNPPNNDIYNSTTRSPKQVRQVALRAFRTTYKSALTISFIGLVGISLGIVSIFTNPYDLIFKWKCIFGEGGEIYELWKTPPVELYLEVYLWNVTNKEDYMSGKDKKLKVQEVGPYVYRELMSHENITFNNNGTLTSIPSHPLKWVPEKSKGRKEDDLLILPNIALLSIADVVSDQSYFTRLGLNMLVRRTDSEPLVQMTAKEFMFGYSSTLMTLGNNFMPSWIFFDKLGLIDRMYDFNGDYETFYTGEDDYRKSGLLDTYTGSTKLPQWDLPCGNIQNASDGTKFQANIQPDDKLLFFRKSMCRSKYLVHVNDTVSHGMDAYVYNFAPDSDDNGKFNKNNTCFCKNPDKCLPPGLLDVRGCYYGFPIALSNPHFLDADPITTAKVEGMNPKRENHTSYFVIQPFSGLPLDVNVRFQINMALGNIKTIANCDRFDNMVLPLLWAEMKMEGLPDYLSTRFQLYINILPKTTEILQYFFVVSGFCALFYSIYKFIVSRRNKRVFNSPWIEDDVILNIERKLSNYIPEKRSSLTPKELEGYIDSLVTPLNQDISFHEFISMKEEDV